MMTSIISRPCPVPALVRPLAVIPLGSALLFIISPAAANPDNGAMADTVFQPIRHAAMPCLH